MNMFEANSLVYHADHPKNWSREEMELNSYLAGEWRFRPEGARSARVFCTGGKCPMKERRAKPAAPDRETHAWHVPNYLMAVLAVLHLRRSR